MKKAMKSIVTGNFEFDMIADDDLYYKDRNRAIIEIDVGGSSLRRLCFVHRGHPSPNIPQNEFWTVSDLETGLGVGSGATATNAIEDAKQAFSGDVLGVVVQSVTSFIAENGRASQAKKPVIREGTTIFWLDEGMLMHARVASKRMDLTETAPVALITHDPTCVVDVEDVLYVWPTKEDLCPTDTEQPADN